MPLYLRAILQLSEPGSRERWSSYAKLIENGVPTPDDPAAMNAARNWLRVFGSDSILAEVRRATFREEADFGYRIEAIPGAEQFKFLLPEIQEMRALARLLDIRIRVAIADRDYPEAVSGLQDGFRLAGAMRESRLLIVHLVGGAIAESMLENVRLLSEAPGAPNLYWALATLPRPLIPMPYSIAFEVDLSERLLPELPNVPIGAEGWNKYLRDTLRDAYEVPAGPNTIDLWTRELKIALGVMHAYPQAKAALIAAGIPQSAVEDMPAAEVVMRHLRRQLRIAGDDLQKWLLLPPQVQQITNESRKDPLAHVLQQHSSPTDPVRIFVEILPVVPVAAGVKSRVQTRVSAAMTVEAIRAHAAAHEGRLPEQLDQLEPLPALPDPRTGDLLPWELRTTENGPVGVLQLVDLYEDGLTVEYHVRIVPDAE